MSRKLTEETKRKISETLKAAWATEEYRRKLREGRRGLPKSEEHRRKLSESLKGFTHTEESRRKMSEAHKGVPLSKGQRRRISEVQRGRKASEESVRKRLKTFSAPKYRLLFRANGIATRARTPNKETGIEKKTKAWLDELGVEYKPQFPFAGIGIADFYLPEHNLVIECDGEYWHRDRKERDERKDAKLNEMNIRVLRLPENLINKYPTRCKWLIKQHLITEDSSG